MWDFNKDLLAYALKESEYQISESLNQISTLTKDLTEFVTGCISNKRSIIIAYPDTFLAPIPIICTNFVLENRYNIKDIMVFSMDNNEKIGSNPLKIHIRNLSGIAEKRDFLYNKAVFCNYDQVEETANIVGNYTLIQKQSARKQHSFNLANDLAKRQKPAIFLSGKKFSRIPSNLKSIKFRDQRIPVDIKTNIGLYIFENVDRFVYSQSSFESFMKWISLMKTDNVNFIFHFSNPYNRYLMELKDRLDSLVFHYGSSLMKQSKSHYEYKLEEKIKNPELILRYAIDNPATYLAKASLIALKPFKSYNLDERIAQCEQLYQEYCSQKGDITDRNIKTLDWLIYQFRNMVVKPSEMKVLFWSYENNGICHKALQSFLEELFMQETVSNDLHLMELLTKINSLCEDFNKVKRSNDEGHFPILKSYAILDFSIKLLKDRLDLLSLKEANEYQFYLTEKFYNRIDIVEKKDQYKVIIIVFNKYERNYLKREFEKFISEGDENYKTLKDKIEIYTLNQISRKRINPFLSDLVLPGPLPLRYFSEYFRGYDNVFLLSYEGINHKTVNEHIQLIEEISQDDAKRSFGLLIELLDSLNINHPEFVTEYMKKYGKISIENISKEKNEENTYTKVRALILKDERFRNSMKESKENEKLHQYLTEPETDYVDKQHNYDYSFTLVSIDPSNSSKVQLDCMENWTYLCVKDKREMKLEEYHAKLIETGDYIIIIESNIRRNFIDFIIQTFDIDEEVDTLLIDSWKVSLTSYLKKKLLNSEELYAKYVGHCQPKNIHPKIHQTFLNWIKGDVTSTRDADDLLILGEIIDDKFLRDNYQIIHEEVKKLWAIRALIGRKIATLIRELLEGTLDLEKLSFEEMQLFEKLQIYEVIAINHISTKEK